jgi:hypothetical protein
VLGGVQNIKRRPPGICPLAKALLIDLVLKRRLVKQLGETKLNELSVELCKVDDLRLQNQLMMSLKFHHREILKQIPRDLALQAMNQAWFDSQISTPSR